MSDRRAPFSQLEAFTDAKRKASLTGQLIGVDLPGRDVILQDIVPRFDAAIAEAQARAKATGKPVEIDGAAISLTDGGDTWVLNPDGTMGRYYSRYTGFDDFLSQVASRPALDWAAGPIDRSEILETAYHAFWSPSATNWQPMRVLEVVGEPAAALARLAGWPAPPAGFPVLAVLRRDHYESLLGDVLEPFGLEVTAREESIDSGIFGQTLIMSAMSRGLTVAEHEFTADQLPTARDVLTTEIETRLKALEGTSDAALEREREVLTQLCDALGRGKYIPDAVMAIGRPVGPVKPYPDFDRIIGEHSTQRVASPNAEFGHDAVMRLWDVTRNTLPEADRDLVRFADFSWHGQVPKRIGKAMFESLYGLGADPESKAGGEGGILTAVNVKNFLLHTVKSAPDYIRAYVPAGWEDKDEAELRRVASKMPVRAQDLGRFLRERILRDGKYSIQLGLVADQDGRPLSVPLLVRMMKSLASTFGNFFLKFQNTHPQNAVLLADTRSPDLHHTYRAVGRAAAVLTYLSRAEGASSIIKTGPIDLARDAVRAVLSENPDGLPHLTDWHPELVSAALQPAMTFQVGMPLTGTDLVDAGTPGEHSGLEERKRDKRPPREDFLWHYLPPV